jgi:phosphatidylglycerol:prolipoprotein diacylglycerol transferase
MYTQGVFVLLSFLWGSFLLWKHVSLTPYKEEDVFDALFISLFGGLLVGRLLFVIFNFETFGFDILKFILINGYPGMNGVGVIFGFFLTFYLSCLSKKVSFAKLIDYVVSPFLLSLAIIKLGSFFSGNEIGAQTNFFLALKYPSLDGARHLTPLYESILFFLASFMAHNLMKRIRRERYTEGFGFFFFLWCFGFITAVFDPLKSFQSTVYGISFQLIVGATLLLTVSIYFVYHFRKFIGDHTFALFKRKAA